jgi:hypothetical protein
LPAKLSTTVNKIRLLPNEENAKLVLKFHEFMKENGASERHQNNNLKAILTFSNIDSNQNNNIDSVNIIILKKVRSLRQLRRTEKELVKLCYKEAIIKGFTLKSIQQYIASKTKIWIGWSCLEQLKKVEEQENREWFYHMVKDHFAYIGAYRKCIDEIAQYKKEVWKIVIDTETDKSTKIQALKELHSLSKTYTLLIKDIPFVTNISKHYNKDILNSNYFNQGFYDNQIDGPNHKKNDLTKDQFDFAGMEDSHITDNINSLDKYENREEKFEKAFLQQSKYNVDTPISKEHLECIRKL